MIKSPLAALLLITLGFIVTPSSEVVAAKIQKAKVLRAIDGNTLSVKLGGKTRRITLFGVRVLRDNEVRMRLRFIKASGSQKLHIISSGRKAQTFLASAVKRGKTVKLQKDRVAKDRFGNPTYYVFAGKKLLNFAIIKRGFSNLNLDNPTSPYKKDLRKALRKAIKKKEALWRLWEQENKLRRRDLSKLQLKYAAQKRITFMSFNLENLFDTKKDPGKRDYEYLPIGEKKFSKIQKYCKRTKWGKEACFKQDWTPARLTHKMGHLAKIVFHINNGQGPDIIVLQEVENYGVLKQWRDKHLKKFKYKIVHVESRDKRGIDVAILSKLSLAEIPRYHELPISFDTRGILEATFLMPNKELISVFAIHFPAQMADTKYRQQALAFLTKLRRGLPPGRMVVAGGDSNVDFKESKAGIFRDFAPGWKVSHHVGCKGCKGTSHWEGNNSWSFFDVFMFSDKMMPSSSKRTSWVVDKASIRVVNDGPNQANADGTPKRYKYPTYEGVSDHFPLAMDLVLAKSRH